MGELFAPVCSITTTKRRRFFWAAWWSGPPTRVPFRKPDASDGGATTRDEALATAEKRAGASLVMIDPLWARAWLRILRGEPAWPSRASREPGTAKSSETKDALPSGSIWELLGVNQNASEAELKAAFRKRVLEAHPDQGGDDEAFRRLMRAHEEARRRLRKPKPRRP
jgi:hypothetical protein